MSRQNPGSLAVSPSGQDSSLSPAVEPVALFVPVVIFVPLCTNLNRVVGETSPLHSQLTPGRPDRSRRNSRDFHTTSMADTTAHRVEVSTRRGILQQLPLRCERSSRQGSTQYNPRTLDRFLYHSLSNAVRLPGKLPLLEPALPSNVDEPDHGNAE